MTLKKVETKKSKSGRMSKGKSESIRTGTTPADLKQAILHNLYFIQARVPELATPHDWYMALAYAIRDRIQEGLLKTLDLLRDKNAKMVAYLSAEFLEGPHLGNNLINLGIREHVQQAVTELGLDLETLLRQEPERHAQQALRELDVQPVLPELRSARHVEVELSHARARVGHLGLVPRHRARSEI